MKDIGESRREFKDFDESKSLSDGSTHDVWFRWALLLRKSSMLWDQVECDGCNKHIWGACYKCRTCSNVVYCISCFEGNRNEHPNHQSDEMQPLQRSAPAAAPAGQDASQGVPEAELEFYMGHRFNGTFKRLDEAVYPYRKSETVQDALRKTMLLGQSISIRTQTPGAFARTDEIPEKLAFLVEKASSHQRPLHIIDGFNALYHGRDIQISKNKTYFWRLQLSYCKQAGNKSQEKWSLVAISSKAFIISERAAGANIRESAGTISLARGGCSRSSRSSFVCRDANAKATLPKLVL
ncbi:hypothetical protein EJ03DRAFT_149893 [Teratosphaeria nubilosa]|uniref:Uncharacterized protein n=1 Tax=Teratosphaeria nubilosa TaxID=161662 RepID=A0A6G1LJ81_9PEZI|nr:hypothetical protein EJ03DRAFT_149893 [Teratosphaeria nubilosa]